MSQPSSTQATLHLIFINGIDFRRILRKAFCPTKGCLKGLGRSESGVPSWDFLL